MIESIDMLLFHPREIALTVVAIVLFLVAGVIL